MAKKFITSRIDEEKYKEFKTKLIQDGLTVQQWIEQNIDAYLENKEVNNK